MIAGADTVNPARTGTKVAAHHVLEIPAGGSAEVRVRLHAGGGAVDFDAVFAERIAEADAFYAGVIPGHLDADAANVMRQSLAGLLWGKQYYEYDVHRWLREQGVDPWGKDAAGSGLRNVPWFHFLAGDVISMPDKWEYPWFAAWDLAFHCAPLGLVDIDFAKEQVALLLRTRYQHPNGQIPAYEWNFSDVNPPVTAWAALWVYEREVEQRGKGDREFLVRVFDRLLTNFTWWVNRKDPDGRNLFQGGFLGLDNIGIFDRSAPLPGGGTLEQADGTAWMALYCQWMLQIAVELAREDDAYADMALKFISHFQWIAIAMNPPQGDAQLWDEQDGFYYDVMRTADGSAIPLRVRSLVGLLPLCAATVFDSSMIDRNPEFIGRAAPGGGAVLRRRRLRPRAGAERARAPARVARRRGPAAADPRRDARRGGVPRAARDPRDLAPPPGRAVRVRLGRPGVPRLVPPGGVGLGHVRRQLELARAGLVPDEPGHPARAAPAPPVLRRRVHDRVPDGLRAGADARAGRGRDRAPADEDVHARQGREAAGVRGDGEVPDRPALARPDPVPRVLPRRQRRRDRGEPPDRLDRHRGAAVRDRGRAAARDLRGQHGGLAGRAAAGRGRPGSRSRCRGSRRSG